MRNPCSAPLGTPSRSLRLRRKILCDREPLVQHARPRFAEAMRHPIVVVKPFKWLSHFSKEVTLTYSGSEEDRK
jgi:hypothetical protein